MTRTQWWSRCSAAASLGLGSVGHIGEHIRMTPTASFAASNPQPGPPQRARRHTSPPTVCVHLRHARPRPRRAAVPRHAPGPFPWARSLLPAHAHGAHREASKRHLGHTARNRLADYLIPANVRREARAGSLGGPWWSRTVGQGVIVMSPDPAGSHERRTAVCESPYACASSD